MMNSRPFLECTIIGLSEDTTVNSLGSMVIKRHPSLCKKSLSFEMVSGKKVKNVRHPTDATFENMT